MGCAFGTRVFHFPFKPFLNGLPGYPGTTTNHFNSMRIQHDYCTLAHIAGQKHLDSHCRHGWYNIGFATTTNRRIQTLFFDNFAGIN